MSVCISKENVTPNKYVGKDQLTTCYGISSNQFKPL